MDASPRRLGLIGGMSWHSTIDYYRQINAAVADALGGHHSADLVLASLDFAQVRACQVAEDWNAAGELLAEAGRRLQGAGAEAVAICTNLMHKCAPAIEAAVDVPLVHIADAVATRAAAVGVTRTLGVVGTRWVMEEPFYADRLASHGIGVVVPDAATRAELDRIVFDELTRGVVTEASRAVFAGAFTSLAAAGAKAIALSCTEIQLLVTDADASVPLIDSLAAHADALAAFALGRSKVSGSEVDASGAPGQPAASSLSKF